MSYDRGGWYAVSLSNGVPPGTSNGTHLFGEEIVVWREVNAVPHVWADRCPHRGMRLSYGFVRANSISCLYHGWQYGGDGRCLHIPAHPALEPPASIAVWRHSAHEAAGLIFARFGESEGAPTLPAEAARRDFVPVRSIHVECPADILANRFAALAIVPFGQALRGETFSFAATGSVIGATVEKHGIGEMLIGAVQPIGDNRSALHVVVAGDGMSYRGAAQRHFSRQIERLRDDIEGGSLPMTGSIALSA